MHTHRPKSQALGLFLIKGALCGQIEENKKGSQHNFSQFVQQQSDRSFTALWSFFF
jgi:hypothetical protein